MHQIFYTFPPKFYISTSSHVTPNGVAAQPVCKYFFLIKFLCLVLNKVTENGEVWQKGVCACTVGVASDLTT